LNFKASEKIPQKKIFFSIFLFQNPLKSLPQKKLSLPRTRRKKLGNEEHQEFLHHRTY
jgi:hypothetical protein